MTKLIKLILRAMFSLPMIAVSPLLILMLWCIYDDITFIEAIKETYEMVMEI